MKTKELITNYKGLSRCGLRNKITDFLKGGTIAFEHGFKKPILTSNHITYSVSMIESNGNMHCKSILTNLSLPTKKVTTLRASQLLKLIKTINEYYNYCLNEA